MMKTATWLNKIVCAVVTIYGIVALTACANIVPPSGGPRDTIPPYRIVAKPKDSSIHVSPKEIWIGFNEYITTTSIQENLIVSPTLKNTPIVASKLSTLQIRLNDSLQANTTYQLQFGTAIKDVNEGNIAQNFSYVFSTGDHIDTGRIQGTVYVAETGKVDSTLLVILQPIGNDTAIFKNRPLYFAKLNGKGKFAFDFLPNQAFNVFVLPNDYTKKYDDSTKLFAFNNEPVIANRLKDSIQLYAFQAYPKAVKKKINTTNNKQVKRNSATLKYAKNWEGNEMDLLHAMHLVFENPVHLNDSFPIVLADTLNARIEDYRVYIDSMANNTIVIDYAWPSSTKFHLIVPQKAIQDTLNNILVKTDTLSFITKPAKAYGSCMIRLNGFEQFKNPILLLTQEDKVKFSYPITKNLLSIAQLPAGEFQLKILQDENNNGKWDTGKFGFGQKNLQPEKVLVLTSKLNIRADWDNELILTFNK